VPGARFRLVISERYRLVTGSLPAQSASQQGREAAIPVATVQPDGYRVPIAPGRAVLETCLSCRAIPDGDTTIVLRASELRRANPLPPPH